MKFGLATASPQSDVLDDIVVEQSTPWVAASDGNLAALKKSLVRSYICAHIWKLCIECCDDH